MNRRDLFALGAAAAALVPGLRIAPAQAAGHAATGIVAARDIKVGEATVTAFSDGFLPIGPDNLTGIDAEGFAARMAQAYLSGEAHLTGVNAYLVDNGGARVLIDAGTGTAFGPTLGHLGANMAALGIDPASIDTLCATHLHPDHIGGVLTEDGNPFSQATLRVAKADLDFWTSEEIKLQAPEAVRGFFDMAVGAVAAFEGRVDAFEGAADMGAGLTAMPLPGHTPGHSGYLLASGNDSLLLWGDIVHVGPVQFAQPEVTIGFDTDQPQAAATRARVLDMAATDRLRVAGAHISFPGTGYVEKAAEGYRFVAQTWQYG